MKAKLGVPSALTPPTTMSWTTADEVLVAMEDVPVEVWVGGRREFCAVETLALARYAAKVLPDGGGLIAKTMPA